MEESLYVLLKHISDKYGSECVNDCIKTIQDNFNLIPKYEDLGIKPIIPVVFKLVVNCSGYKKKNGYVGLEFDMRQNKKRKRVNTHIYIPDKKYFKHGMLQKDCPNYTFYKSQINLEIKNMMDILEIFNKKEEPYDIIEVVDAYRNKMSKSSTLMDFFNSQMITDDRSQKTIEGYRSTLRCVDKIIPNMTIIDLTEHNMRKLEKEWKEMGISHNTISSRQNHIRAISNKAMDLNLLKVDPFDKIKIKTMTKKEGTLSSDEMDKFKLLNVETDVEYIKDIALISAHTGLRFSDVTRLTSDVIDNGWITIKTQKTKKVVHIPYRNLDGGEIVDEIIKKYGKIEKLTKRKWSNSEVNKKLKIMFQNIGIPKEKRFTFHTLRHYFATNALRHGLSAEIVQQMLGHTKIQTTLIYTEIDKETIESSIKNAIIKGKLK